MGKRVVYWACGTAIGALIGWLVDSVWTTHTGFMLITTALGAGIGASMAKNDKEK
jgi:F0F1-type ATP synthase assembly protein I